MKFSDYSDDYTKLVGNYVPHETGTIYSEKTFKRIVKITKVMKTGFNVNNEKDIFNFSGHKKGLSAAKGREKVELKAKRQSLINLRNKYGIIL